VNTQLVLTKEESANVLAFQDICRARAEGYAAAMRDAAQIYLARVVEGKKKQAANPPREGGENGAL
jgi:hypothetical protein